jgi:tellurite resistance protein TerC
MLDRVWLAAEVLATFLGTEGEHVTLFHPEEVDAWIVLACAFSLLLLLDLAWTYCRPGMSMRTACASVLLCVGCGMAFNVYVYFRFGQHAAWQWASAYALEWLLSFDNLFVFHQIFTAYKTPVELRYRPLMIGIFGALILRLVALYFAEFMMHKFWVMHLIFGVFLVYTGLRTISEEEDEEEEYRQGPVSKKIGEWIPLVSYYDPKGAFFVQVEEDKEGANYGAIPQKTKVWKGTVMVLVLVSLELTDILFAIDSISAIAAQVDHLFLAYSAIVFAMLGLRAGYFVVDALAQTFKLFKFGIAAILIFIGIKLMCAHFYTMPPAVVLLVMPCTLTLSVLSVVLEKSRLLLTPLIPKALPVPA